MIEYTPDARPAEGDEWTIDELRIRADEKKEFLAQMAALFRIPLLLGMDSFSVGAGTIDRHNSAVLVAADGAILGRYDKMRPVMFGEYIPFGGSLPWLYRLTPLAEGVDVGARAGGAQGR